MKKVLKMSGFLLLLILAMVITYDVYKLKDTNGGPVSAIHMMKEMDSDLVDVFFMGTSHVFCGISPAAMWEHSGIAAYDLSVSGMDLESTYYTLKYFVKEYNPKIVFVDVYGFTFDGYSNGPVLIGNKYRNLIQLPFSNESVELAKKMTDEDETRNYLLRFPIIHTRYKELGINDFVTPKLSEYNRGEYIVTNSCDYLDLYSCYDYKETVPLSDEHIEWVERMEELAKEEGFEIVFIKIPYTDLNGDSQKKLNGFSEYAEEKGYKYLDIQYKSARLGLSLTDFGDPTHMNTYGAQKISNYIAEYIDENYSLEDHRGDSRYEVWDNNSKYVKMCLEKNNIKNGKIIDEDTVYLSRIQNLLGLTNIVVYRGENEEHYNPIEDYLEMLGIEFAEYINGGVWVIEGKKITQIMSMNEEGTFYYDLAKDLGLKVQKTEDDFCLQINAEELETLESGMVVFSYDVLGNEMVESKYVQ